MTTTIIVPKNQCPLNVLATLGPGTRNKKKLKFFLSLGFLAEPFFVIISFNHKEQVL